LLNAQTHQLALEILSEILQDAQLLVPRSQQPLMPFYFLPEPVILAAEHGEIPWRPAGEGAAVTGIVPAGTRDPDGVLCRQRRCPYLDLADQHFQLLPFPPVRTQSVQGHQAGQFRMVAPAFPVLDRAFGRAEQPGQRLLAQV
jgi:hypothetical protein